MPVIESCNGNGGSHEVGNLGQQPTIFRLLPRSEELDPLGAKLYFLDYINLDPKFSVTYMNIQSAEAICALVERYLNGESLDILKPEFEVHKPSIRRVKRKV